MTRTVRTKSIITHDAGSQLSSSPPTDSSGLKTPTGSAMLAQQLASDSSWADRYVPSTPSESVMTPGSSVADHSEHLQGSEYMTPNEAPPSYEEVTSAGGSQAASPTRSRGQPPSSVSISQSGPRRPFLPGRRYSRHETSQSIQGTFTLYDSLDLSTTSGTISIKLDVQPGPDPARLSLKTKSGSVSINDKQCDIAMSHHTPASCPSRRSNSGGLLSFLWGGPSTSQTNTPPLPTSDDPRKQSGQHLMQESESPDTTSKSRVIHTTIETSSGSVNGHLLLTATSSTHIKTQSGSINLRLVTSDTAASLSSTRPVSKLDAEDTRFTNSSNLESILTTTSSSGSQSIHIATGVSDTSSGALVSACRSKHYCTGSSSINAHYPRDWTGLVHASSGGSGSVNVNGQGMEYDRRGNREVWAWRGESLPDVDKAIVMRGDGSGSIGFQC